MQAKLLRAIEERTVRPVGGDAEIPVDVRILAATHRDLRARVSRGTFRADLFHRLSVLEVRVPPLRERPDDLPDLIEDLAPRLRRETGHGPPRLSRPALDALRAHSWPGNVRELHAVLARALLRAGSSRIDARHLSFPRLPDRSGAEARERDPDLEARMVREALASARGNIAEAARRIGWTRQKLYRRMHKLSEKTGATDRQVRTTSSCSSTFQ
jgi:DNA-binding NtrC family response regulator